MKSLSQRLRQKLLDLAIHGKLVSQDPHDEPASDLLARIRKARSAQNGRARRSATAVPIADDEIPFDLPKGWTWCRLGEVCDVFAGYPFDSKKYAKSGIRICGGLIIMPDQIKWGECKYWTDSEGLEDYLLKSEDVVIALDRPWISSGTKIGIVKERDLPCLLIQRTARLRSEVLDARYLVTLLGGDLFRQFCDPTGTTIPHISSKDIEAFPIPLPPLAEQKRIVEKLNGLLDAVTKFADGETRLVHLRKKARTKILDLAIRGKLVKQEKGDEPSLELLKRIAAEKTRLVAAKKIKKEKPLPPIGEEEIPFDLPKGWSWVRIGDICTGFQYGTAEKSQPTGLVPVLRMGNLQGGELDFSDLVYTSNKQDIKAYALSDGDLLFNRTNSDEKVGKVSIFRGDRPCIYAGYLVRFRPLFCDSEYINIVMNTHYQWMFCQSVKSDAVNQSNISASKFVKFPVPVPPLAEQKRIAAKVKEMLAACDALGGVE